MNIRTLRLFSVLITILGQSFVYAHGGVAIEVDKCVARIGKFTMHFTAYQVGSGTEYCWDLPAPGKSILVFDLLDTAMRTKPTEVRVVETAEEGGSASIVRTVAHLDPRTYPTGTIDLNGNFEAGKRYAAVVTLRDARPLVSRLPIQVRESAGIQLTFIAGAMFLIAVVLGALQWRQLPIGRGGSMRSRKI